MQNKPFRFGPVTVPNAVGNVLNPGTTTGGVNSGSGDSLYIILTHIRVVNRTAGAVAFSAFIGATGGSAAGTEFMGSAKSVPANDAIDWYGRVRLDVADFLTALAGALNSLTIQGEGEIGIR
jgi:hypothetical protein